MQRAQEDTYRFEWEVPTVNTLSVWQDTKTFFPIFRAELARRPAKTVCVVGASDGKFVVPLAQDGYRILAIEPDRIAIDGGAVEFPENVQGEMLGLRQRLAYEEVADRVEIVESDIFDAVDLPPADAVWTSCSWHYPMNYPRPLEQFISRMQAFCTSGGVVGAEYMMPVEPEHVRVEHYLEQGAIRSYFSGWDLLWEAYTPPFIEAPHIEVLEPHVHRMGFIVAQHPGVYSERRESYVR